MSGILIIGTGGGGRGGLGSRGGAPAPRPLPFVCLLLILALLIAGLRMTVDACVEMERAGEDRVGDSGDEERLSRWNEDAIEDSRSLEGIRAVEDGTGKSCIRDSVSIASSGMR